jgi:hypothetical protein
LLYRRTRPFFLYFQQVGALDTVVPKSLNEALTYRWPPKDISRTMTTMSPRNYAVEGRIAKACAGHLDGRPLRALRLIVIVCAKALGIAGLYAYLGAG